MADIRRIEDLPNEATAMDTGDFAVIDGPTGTRKIGRNNLFNSVPIGANTVGTTQLADDAVTNAKLANMAAATFKGRNTGTGDPEDLDVATVLTLLGFGAWTAITPTVSSQTGTLTSASGGIRYKQFGKLVVGAATATIATNGTGATALDISTASLPGISATLSVVSTAFGFESGVSNRALSVSAATTAGTTNFRCRFYDGTYPGANSARMTIGFLYEAA